MWQKQVPNVLTVSRIIFSFLFVVFFLQQDVTAKVIAAVFFLFASITDFFDGYYARKYQLISNFGKIMDPIADKCLMLSAFWVFCLNQLVQPWMFVVIFIREVSVTLFRLVAIKKGVYQAAEKSGKVKTVAQIVVVYVMLFFVLYHVFSGHYRPGWQPEGRGLQFIHLLMYVAVGLTVYSGGEYVWLNIIKPIQSGGWIESLFCVSKKK
ncbi:MAG: CDP-diacylglycerol--glycerol-3-phosphate 3-phosphatidyltransferase [Candidatus Omnitrophica bacterium]|nr:CDP-diacylglycerol--glycerol-3-phosphate 3-phosphatidyltransferase [Candidatus Omnitrophota bacterium]